MKVKRREKKIQNKDAEELKDCRRDSKGREKTSQNSRIKKIVLQHYSPSILKLRTESIRLFTIQQDKRKYKDNKAMGRQKKYIERFLIQDNTKPFKDNQII